MDRKAYIIIGIAVLLVIGGLLYWYNQRDTLLAVTSFEECANANYPILQTDPRQCVTPDGRSFTEEKKQGDETATDDSNIDAKKDLIRVSGIQPNQVVKSPLKVSGEARGTWFFEASFPVKLLDANGKVLVTAVAQAEGEWMTTNFVPFEATLTFVKPTTATGMLVLEKDNPSGLAEHADELRIPIRFE